MRVAIGAVVVVLCLVLPATLLTWLLRCRAQSRAYLASVALLTAVVLLVLTLSVLGAWYLVGVFWPWIFAAVFVLVLARRLRGGLPEAWLPRRFSRELFLTTANVVLIALCSPVLSLLARADAYEGEPLSLASPLGEGRYYVMGGGANASVNHHAFLPEQRYALDVLELNALGFRAAGLSPADLDAYLVFGAEVVAPCDGEVIATRDGRPNRTPMDPDTTDPFGNHVVLFCQGSSVLLAHLQAGTVAVSVGELVTAGRRLGAVGNSGSTLEPHLHLHAVRGRSPDGTGSATPLLVDGRFLTKGESF